MFIVEILSWWYGAGWRQRIAIVGERLASTMDYFSIGLLLQTLFSPFRQISAGQVNGPIAVKWRAFVDRLISRCIGGVVRLILIIVGIAAIIFFGLIGLISVVIWGIIPLLPVFGIAMMLIGWTPSWM